MTESDDILINKYFSNSLNQDEKLEFEKKLMSNSDFKESFELIQKVKSAVDLNSDKFKLKVNKVINNKPPYKEPKYLLFLILLIGSLVFSYFLITTSLKKKPTNLYAEYFEPYPDDITVRNNNSKNNGTLNNLLSEYSSGNYKQVILYAQKNKEDFNLETTSFFLANAYLAENQYEKAIQILESDLFFEDSIYYIQARWYLALTYLKQGEIQKARAIFEVISKNKTHKKYSQASQKILNNL